MRRLIYLVIIILTTIVPYLLALYVIKDEASTFVWSLYIIPNYVVLLYSSKWRTAIVSNLVFTAIEVISQYYFLASENVTDLPLILILIPIINSTIFFTLAYVRIKFKSMNDELTDLVVHDPLTGIYNRRYFETFMEKSVADYLKTKSPFQIILFDIDHFKGINDTYGHPFGDFILKQLTTLIGSEITNQSIFTRIGGEEFAIIMPQLNLDEGKEIAQKIRYKVEQFPFQYHAAQIQVTISIGLASYNGESIDEYMEKVDSALYKAKTNGRNQVVAAN